MEIWKDIKGYEGYYQVSNQGRVKSLNRTVSKNYNPRRIRERILKVRPDKDGYLCVTLSVDNVKKGFPVHRLVAMTFIPNPENKRTVNHIDGDKTNNCVENLEWATDLEQTVHGIRLGIINPHHTKNRRRRRVIRGDGIIYDSIKEAAEKNNLFTSNIIVCCQGKVNSIGGYHWDYYSG